MGHFSKCCRSQKPNKQKVLSIDEEYYQRNAIKSRDSGSSDDEYTFTLSTQPVNRDRPEIYAKVNGKGFKFLVDTGATVNIVNAEVASQIAVKVQQCSTRLFTFNSEKPLTACGKFTAQLRYKHRNVKCDFVVVEGSCCSIISYATACDLGVLKFIFSVQESDVICNQYPQLFQGIGKMKDTEVKLHIDSSVVPVSQSHRHFPFHQRKCFIPLLPT